MPFDPYIQKALLDWCTGAAAVTRPSGLFVGFESGTPTWSSDSGAPVFRSSISFMSASTGVSAFASNVSSLSLSCSTTCTIFGWALYQSTSGGSRFMWGTLSATHTLRAGSDAGFAASNLVIILA